MIRTIFFWLLVVSFFGLGLCDCMKQEWRTGAASFMLGIVQLVIFWR